MIVNGEKRCPRCLQSKVPDGNFYRITRRSGDGFDTYCIDCRRGISRVSMVEYMTKPEKRAMAIARDRERWRRAPKKGRSRKYHTDEERRAALADRQRRHHSTPQWRSYHAMREHMRRQFRMTGVRGDMINYRTWQAICAVFDNRCAYCPAPAAAVDHFVPVSTGGPHTVANVVPVCKSCNSSKKHRDPFAWMESRGVDADRVVALICAIRDAAAAAA